MKKKNFYLKFNKKYKLDSSNLKWYHGHKSQNVDMKKD